MDSNEDLQKRLDRIGKWEIFDVDWAHLRELAALGIVELCALSMGIHPEYARLIDCMTTIDPEEILAPEEIAEMAAYRNDSIAEMRRRVAVAVNHIKAGTLPIVMNDQLSSDAENIVVKVTDFTAWTIGMGWTLPDEFPRHKEAETPAQRRERLKARVTQEKAKGTKDFLVVVAAEEGLSTARVKQIVNKKTESANNGKSNANKWTALLPTASKTSSSKPKPKT